LWLECIVLRLGLRLGLRLLVVMMLTADGRLASTQACKGKPGVSNIFPDVILFLIDEVPPIDEMAAQVLHARPV
jgi:hypothetical protein